MTKERIVCLRCGKTQLENCYHEPNAKLYGSQDDSQYPKQKLPICSDCVHQIYNFSIREDVLEYLRLINRPFIVKQWEKAITKDKEKPMNAYLAVIANLTQYRKLEFDNSDGYTVTTKKDMLDELDKIQITDKVGNVIKVTPEVVSRWGNEEHYTEQDYARMEKYYIDTKLDYEISTSIQEQMLVDLSKLNLQKDKLRNTNISDYEKVSRVFSNTLKEAGFSPKDKKSTEDEMGIHSFGQVIKRLENENGFIPPDRIHYEKDDLDNFMLFYIQGAQGFNQEQKWAKIPENWRDMIVDDEFKVDVEANIETLDSQDGDIL